MKRITEIEARMLEIRGILESDATDIDLDVLEVELRSLSDEKAQIEKRQNMFKSINIQSRQADPPKDPEKEEQFRDFGEFLQTVKYNPHDQALRVKEVSDKTQKRF